MFTAKETETLQSHWLSRLATVSSQGKPHLVPVAYAFDGSYFYASSDRGSRKLKNVAVNPNVCLLIDEHQNPRWGIMVEGQADLLSSGPDYIRAGKLLGHELVGEHYMHAGHPQIIIRIKPERKVSWGIE
ncbi:MAG: pyridoxamine 5'-phosphate oxidase family protein [Candidatus Bathyarchaeia archaeon]